MTNYLYSIRARHVADILNGKKTIELRKSAPKPPFVMWIYVTMGLPYVAFDCVDYDDSWGMPATDCGYFTYKSRYELDNERDENWPILNGHVVAKCVVDSVEEIKSIEGCFHDEFIYTTYPRLLKQLCLSDNEVSNYGKGKPLYALHLSNLEILDKPLQVSKFTNMSGVALTRVPQSYQKVIPPEVRL